MISDYFRAQADWRDLKAGEYPDDSRNTQSATALRSLADFVDSDEAESLVAALQPFSYELGLGGEEVSRAVARYGFGYNATAPAQHEEFLDELLALCLQDAYENVQQNGTPDSEWTGQLLPCETYAAVEGTLLPSSYFRRRRGMTEHEIEEYLASIVEGSPTD